MTIHIFFIQGLYLKIQRYIHLNLLLAVQVKKVDQELTKVPLKK